MNESVPAIDLLVDRLADASILGAVKDLVLAAAVSENALAASLGGQETIGPAPSEQPEAEPPALFLSEIVVEGFRGIATSARLGLRPGPGLTLVVGRNGSGKSSFAEGAELALTGSSSRWEKRTKVWQEGWACLHHNGPRMIELRLRADGEPDDLVVRRRWSEGAGLAGGVATVQRPKQPEEPLADLGLDDPLATWRPFLSYNELGGLLDDGPSRLYDAVSTVLGLEEWVEVESRLTTATKAIQSAEKEARAEATRLRGLLSGLEDERATAALAAMPLRGKWDLEAIEQLATGLGTPTGDVAELEALVALPLPDLDVVTERTEALRSAQQDVMALAGTDAARAAELAELLTAALRSHEHVATDTCPVCGTTGVLDDDWRTRTTAEVERLRSDAKASVAARQALSRATADVRGLIAPVPARLLSGSALVDTAEALATWQRWSLLPDDPVALADHVQTEAGALIAAVHALREEAAEELQRRRDTWQPVAAQLAAWLPQARRMEEQGGRVADLKAATTWIADEATIVRNERFAPIAQRVVDLWKMIRQASNVSLDTIALEGKRTSRRLTLSVTVDDVDSLALSVMSQGELHALALALFLPRATMTDSPFRFLVIDDPVQAMDLARVDGLARALADVANTHQVIVFTHDERLPDACRRLDLKARVLEVTRAERSQVTVRSRHNPIDDYLDDARSVLNTDGYPAEALRRVVPGLCRNALEAACIDATRRRLMGAGKTFSEVDEAIATAGKFLPRLALALFGDDQRAGDVYPEVNRLWGRSRADLIRALNEGAHGLVDRDPKGMISDTKVLAHAIDELR